MFRPGHQPSDRPTIDSVRELAPEDLVGLERAPPRRTKVLRDSHHMVARLFAMGLKPGEIVVETGYSHQRIFTLSTDPAFQELVAHYREMVDEAYVARQDDYWRLMNANKVISARMLNDKLCDTEPEDISFRELVMIHADAADRTGHPKRTVAVNVNADFASLLDRAIARSQEAKLIESATPGPLVADRSDDPPRPEGDQSDLPLTDPRLRRTG